jgi:hypothetical protein
VQNLLDTTRGIQHSVNSTAYGLAGLAHSFAQTGNSVVAEKLLALAGSLEFDMDCLKKAVDDNLDEYMAQTFENSNNILRAAMAGIEVGARA